MQYSLFNTQQNLNEMYDSFNRLISFEKGKSNSCISPSVVVSRSFLLFLRYFMKFTGEDVLIFLISKGGFLSLSDFWSKISLLLQVFIKISFLFSLFVMMNFWSLNSKTWYSLIIVFQQLSIWSLVDSNKLYSMMVLSKYKTKILLLHELHSNFLICYPEVLNIQQERKSPYKKSKIYIARYV